MAHSNIRFQTRKNAKQLRRNVSPGERVMWRLLQPFREQGIRFRRQTPIGPYIVDFAWLGGALVIEVDGGQHNEPDHEKRDAARTAWLESQGYQVLRFWTNEVLKQGEGCQAAIAEAVAARPSEPET